MVSPEKPTHFCNGCALAMCWTTTYALCGADAFTHEPAAGDALADGEPPQALTPPSVRASVALAHMRCLRTRLPPGGQPFPNAPLKADRQELPCRCARTGSPFGRSGLLARGSPPLSAFPRWSTSVACFRRRLLANSCAPTPVSHRLPLVLFESCYCSRR